MTSERATKTCRNCGVEKSIRDYHTDRGRPLAVCKPCKKEKLKQYYAENKDKVLAQRKKRRAEDPTAIETAKLWREINIDKVRQYDRQRYQRDKAKRIALIRSRDCTVKQATPKWLSKSQWKEMQRVYDQARDCSIVTGEKYCVDHIVPLNGDNFCGLHVPWNLQVLPSYLNDRKGNSLEE